MRGTLRDDDRPSRTAVAVATGRAIGYRHLHDDLVVPMLPTADRALIRRVRPLASRRVGADSIALATGGLSLHAALRMAAVDAAVQQAVDLGCAQVVVVGAGLDTRAWRLPELAAVPVWEVDRPGTQAVKRAGLSAAGLDPDRVGLLGADLAAERLPDVLAPTSHDPAVPTAWVWEAVAPYLTPDAVAGTLEGIATRSALGSCLIMTFAHPDLIGPRTVRPLTGAMAKVAFRIIGEPILSTYDEWAIASLLDQHGFATTAVTGSRDWQDAAGLSGRPDPAAAEMLATAVMAPPPPQVGVCT